MGDGLDRLVPTDATLEAAGNSTGNRAVDSRAVGKGADRLDRPRLLPMPKKKNKANGPRKAADPPKLRQLPEATRAAGRRARQSPPGWRFDRRTSRLSRKKPGKLSSRVRDNLGGPEAGGSPGHAGRFTCRPRMAGQRSADAEQRPALRFFWRPPIL